MSAGPDLTVYSSTREPRLAVEVKSTSPSTEESAETFRRNLIAHSIIPRSTSFLLAMSDSMYLWPQDQETGPFTLSTREALAPYIGTYDVTELRGNSLQLAVLSWLSDVVNSPGDVESPSTRFFQDAGVWELIRGGRIRLTSDP